MQGCMKKKGMSKNALSLCAGDAKFEGGWIGWRKRAGLNIPLSLFEYIYRFFLQCARYLSWNLIE